MAATPSLRSRALPMAVALALVSLAGFLTEVVAASQMLTLVGPSSLAVIYPLGGVGLLVLAFLQFRFVDHHARLPMIRTVTLGYAVAFGIALALVVGSIAPVVATGLIWLLADQLNFLVPLLIWSLAGDEFNVAEGRKIFGWIVAWTYGGQVLGLVIASASPPILEAVGIPLPWLLVVPPVVCVVIAVWLPRAMAGSAASRGSARPEGYGQSLRSAWDFVSGVPVWRSLLVASTLTFTAGMAVYMGFLTGVEEVTAQDAARMQVVLGLAFLVSFIICWGVQVFFAERLQDRIGIPGALMILPIATIVGAVLVAAGMGTSILAVMLIGIALWWIPRWSIDENARRGALALVPDERRARVSFIIDLGPVAIGLILSAPIALAAIWLDRYWLIPAIGALVAIAAIPFSLRVIRGWEESLLNWRLRRRKQNRTADLVGPGEAPARAEPVSHADASPPRLRVSLRWKILVAFAGAFTLVFAFIAVWVFQFTTDNATTKLITQLEASAVGGAASIDPEVFRDLVTTVEPVPDPNNPAGLGYPDSPLYVMVAEDLFEVNQIIPESQPYTYYRDGNDGQLYFAASGGYFFTPQFGVPFGQPVADVVNAETYALMERGLQELTDQPAYSDDYGSWISAYHPIRNAAGNVVGAIGIDYPLTYVDEVQSSVQRQLYPVLVASYAILLVIVLLLSTSLTRPLKKLTEATTRIAEGEYDLDVESMVPSRFPDEMYVLAQSFAQMARKVGARERSLTQEVQRLKVEIDESRRVEAVKQITETEFFSDLTVKAAEMRKRMREHVDGDADA